MNFWVILTVSSIIVAANSQSDDFALEMKLEELSTNIFARLAKLEAKNKDLEERNNQLEERLAEVDPPRETFDCYRTEYWDTEGIISFNDCSVDTTTGDPRTGFFTVMEPGVYRLTFTGRTVYPATTGDDVPYGYVYMRVNGKVVAKAQNTVYPNQGTILK